MIANAGGYFSDAEVHTVQTAAEQTEAYMSDLFTFDYDVDVIVATPSYMLSTISEDGIGGRTYSSRLIAIVIDKNEQPISEDVVFETLCHELAHSLRWETLPEYSKTLFDAMIFEGLAIAVEEKALNDTGRSSAQFFLKEVQRTSQEQVEAMIGVLGDSFELEEYDYDAVFFAGNDTLPRWAGYRLGYYFVKQQLARGKMSLEELVTASYSAFSPEV